MNRAISSNRARLPAGLLLLAAALSPGLGCTGGDGSEGGSPTQPQPPPGGAPPPPPAPEPEVVLATGAFTLSAATSPGEPGEHAVLLANHVLNVAAAGTANRRLVIFLEDSSRPFVSCPSDEPESGCATVDWSADPADPQVPADGVFINRIQVELVSGVRDFYLSRTRRLAGVSDVADPNSEHTAIGGSRERWEGTLPTDLASGGALDLRLVMTKWQLPAVRISYQILLE